MNNNVNLPVVQNNILKKIKVYLKSIFKLKNSNNNKKDDKNANINIEKKQRILELYNNSKNDNFDLNDLSIEDLKKINTLYAEEIRITNKKIIEIARN